MIDENKTAYGVKVKRYGKIYNIKARKEVINNHITIFLAYKFIGKAEKKNYSSVHYKKLVLKASTYLRSP